MDIIAMHRYGYGIRKIAKIKGIHRKTVKKYLESNSFPHYQKKKRGGSILEPYYQIIKDYLEQDDYQATWIFDRLKRWWSWAAFRKIISLFVGFNEGTRSTPGRRAN